MFGLNPSTLRFVQLINGDGYNLLEDNSSTVVWVSTFGLESYNVFWLILLLTFKEFWWKTDVTGTLERLITRNYTRMYFTTMKKKRYSWTSSMSALGTFEFVYFGFILKLYLYALWKHLFTKVRIPLKEDF